MEDCSMSYIFSAFRLDRTEMQLLSEMYKAVFWGEKSLYSNTETSSELWRMNVVALWLKAGLLLQGLDTLWSAEESMDLKQGIWSIIYHSKLD